MKNISLQKSMVSENPDKLQDYTVGSCSLYCTYIQVKALVTRLLYSN